MASVAQGIARNSTPPRFGTPVRRTDSAKLEGLSDAKRLGETRNIALQTIRILGKVGDDRYEVDSANIISTLKENEQNVFTQIPDSFTALQHSALDGAGPVPGSEKKRSVTPSRFVLPEFQSIPSGLRSYISSSPSKGKLVIPIKTLHVDVNEPLPLPFDPQHDAHITNKTIDVNSRYGVFFRRMPSGSKPLPARAMSTEKAYNVPDEENPRKKVEERKLDEAMRRIAVAKSAPKPVIDFAPKPAPKVSKSFVPACANCDLTRRLQIVEEERRARVARQEKMLKNRPKA